MRRDNSNAAHEPLIRDLSLLRGIIAVFGGSFDPVHLGHVALAKHVLEAHVAEKVLFIPARKNPLKASFPQALDKERIEMLCLALHSDDRMFVSPMEIERPGDSFTIHTLRTLKSSLPDSKLVLLIGADQLPNLHRWRDIDHIFAAANVSLFGRDGISDKDIEKLAPQLPAPLRASLTLTFVHFDFPASATTVRQLLAARDFDSAQKFLDPAVLAYIKQNGIYQKKSEPLQ